MGPQDIRWRLERLERRPRPEAEVEEGTCCLEVSSQLLGQPIEQLPPTQPRA